MSGTVPKAILSRICVSPLLGWGWSICLVKLMPVLESKLRYSDRCLPLTRVIIVNNRKCLLVWLRYRALELALSIDQNLELKCLYI